MGQDLRRAADGRRDDPEPRGRGLQDRVGEPLALGRLDHQVEGAVEVPGVALLGQEHDDPAEVAAPDLGLERGPERAVPDEAEAQARAAVAQRARHLEQQVMALARLEGPDAAGDDVVPGEAPRLAERLPFRGRRRDGHDGVPDDVDLPGGDPLDGDRLVGGRPRVGHHGVDVAHGEAPGDLAVPGPRPPHVDAGAPPGQEHGDPGDGPDRSGERVGGHEPGVDDVDIPGEAPIGANRPRHVPETAEAGPAARLAPQPQHVHGNAEGPRFGGEQAGLRQHEEANSKDSRGSAAARMSIWRSAPPGWRDGASSTTRRGRLAAGTPPAPRGADVGTPPAPVDAGIVTRRRGGRPPPLVVARAPATCRRRRAAPAPPRVSGEDARATSPRRARPSRR